ncbi:Chromosome partition protein mukF [Mannheimia haemolytica]|nr:Chromosome partition protein mukF [Mannheimia haemolytica]
MQNELAQTIPELISWTKDREFSLSLSSDRLAFLLAISIYNQEQTDGELLESDLIDLFRYVSNSFEQSDATFTQRANNAINDLVRQRLLNRFSSEFTEGLAIYRVTPLGWEFQIITFASGNFLPCVYRFNFRLWQMKFSELQ